MAKIRSKEITLINPGKFVDFVKQIDADDMRKAQLIKGGCAPCQDTSNHPKSKIITKESIPSNSKFKRMILSTLFL